MFIRPERQMHYSHFVGEITNKLQKAQIDRHCSKLWKILCIKDIVVFMLCLFCRSSKSSAIYFAPR